MGPGRATGAGPFPVSRSSGWGHRSYAPSLLVDPQAWAGPGCPRVTTAGRAVPLLLLPCSGAGEKLCVALPQQLCDSQAWPGLAAGSQKPSRKGPAGKGPVPTAQLNPAIHPPCLGLGLGLGLGLSQASPLGAAEGRCGGAGPFSAGCDSGWGQGSCAPRLFPAPHTQGKPGCQGATEAVVHRASLPRDAGGDGGRALSTTVAP